MTKQLYYSEIHLKNIKIYLSKLQYNLCEVHDNEVHAKALRLLIVLMTGALLILSRVQSVVLCDAISRCKFIGMFFRDSLAFQWNSEGKKKMKRPTSCSGCSFIGTTVSLIRFHYPCSMENVHPCSCASGSYGNQM